MMRWLFPKAGAAAPAAMDPAKLAQIQQLRLKNARQAEAEPAPEPAPEPCSNIGVFVTLGRF